MNPRITNHRRVIIGHARLRACQEGKRKKKKGPGAASVLSDGSGSSYMEDEALLSADQPVNDTDLLRTFK